MQLYDKLVSHEAQMSVVGLGYVGLPIAVAFSKHAAVIGYDLSEAKINTYRAGLDPTREVGDEDIRNCTVHFTADEKRLADSMFHIVAVPTPVNPDHTPDLSPLIGASKAVGRNLRPGAIVVYESTVYPGATQDICVPILEKESGLTCGADFSVGYSPERINPGDKEHRLDTIVKIVSGMDALTLDTIARMYELVIRAGVYRAESIMVAEAAKVIENCQRDINIAFMNELSIIFNMLKLDTQSVLNAAGTKWNFLKFTPGLVGGHCIGVDPYYLTYKAEQIGYHSQVILSGRHVNDDMGRYVASKLVKQLIAADAAENCVRVGCVNVGILGFTFKEDCPDIRNTRVLDIVKELREYGIEPAISDDLAGSREVFNEYGLTLTNPDDFAEMDALIIAVAHRSYKNLSLDQVSRFYKVGLTKNRILFDLKGILDRREYEAAGFIYWRL
ncbi:UDP-N-acetyl-D-galactosamine dehydrogenase [Clostridia bacterium]|nr:UDP-N-acetyl-D-galactosamine dehydrogenase [Clostridia bacterium]